MKRVLRLVVALGARLAEPGEMTRRAFVNGRLDLTQAEAIAEIVAAQSERALQNARAVLDGALGRRIGALREQALELGAQLEAAIDFAEELELEAASPGARALAGALVSSLGALAQSYDTGRRLGGISVALTGPVNAGKSTLFNALLGRERALVSEEPGTTRDYLEGEVCWQGQRVVLVDTAGARPAGEMSPLERAGHALACERVVDCDLALALVDLSGEEELVRPRARERPGRGSALIVATKLDAVPDAVAQQRLRALAGGAEGARVVGVSARLGLGLEELARVALETVLPPAGAGEQAETVCVTQRRQHEALLRAEEAARGAEQALAGGELPAEIVAEHVRGLLEALDEITGERYSEDVLDAVFSRFCLGK